MKRRRDPIQLRLDRAKYGHVNCSSEKPLITVDILVDRIIALCRLCRLVQLRLSTLNEESLSTCTCAIPHDSPLLVFFVTISNANNGVFSISFLNIPESKHGSLSSWASPFSRSQLVPPPGGEFPRDKVYNESSILVSLRLYSERAMSVRYSRPFLEQLFRQFSRSTLQWNL